MTQTIAIARRQPLAQMQDLWLCWIDSLRRRTASLAGFFDVRMDRMIAIWSGVMVLAGLAKLVTAPIRPHSLGEAAAYLAPYLLVALSPIAGYRIASGSFPRGLLTAQPSLRLACIGRWRQLDVISARRNPLFGPSGLMASLLVGILLNVPVRTAEFLMAIPALGGSAPGWAQTLLVMMSADVIVMNFFYAVCFVMALRSVPLFPRMMVFCWIVDLALQLAIAQQVARAPGLPDGVAHALQRLLGGNIDKVLISMALWLPYLILSERVNVTFRHRCSA